jgi:hypothetical protein
MTSSIYIEFAQYFNDAEQKQKDSGYYLLGLKVPLQLLFNLYSNFLKDGITPIEEIPQEQKQKYFNISKRYYTETKDQIKASKAAYTLDLLTSNE